jgi:hypothetical protein
MGAFGATTVAEKESTVVGIPPNNPPPGGYYAPPPQNSGSSGCWKAAGITCGVLFLLGILLVVGSVMWVKKSGIGETMTGVIASTKDGMDIQKAVVAYHDKKGKYPSALTDLVPDYIPERSTLHSALDPDSDPGHVTWKYTKPPAGASGKTPLLELDYEIKMKGMPGPSGEGVPQSVIINLDGSQTTASPGMPGGSPSGPAFGTVPGGLGTK